MKRKFNYKDLEKVIKTAIGTTELRAEEESDSIEQLYLEQQVIVWKAAQVLYPHFGSKEELIAGLESTLRTKIIEIEVSDFDSVKKLQSQLLYLKALTRVMGMLKHIHIRKLQAVKEEFTKNWYIFDTNSGEYFGGFGKKENSFSQKWGDKNQSKPYDSESNAIAQIELLNR